MNRKIISILAPRAPPCFATRDIWLEFLASSMDAGLKEAPDGKFKPGPVARPFVNSQFNPGWSYCTECLPSYQRRMRAESRCHPPPIAQEARQDEQAA